MTDQPTPTPEPETNAAPGDAPEAPGEASTTDALVLTAPPPVATVAPTQAERSLAVDPNDVANLDSIVDRYLDGVTSLDVHGPDFAKRVDELRTMGDEDVRASAAVSNALLDKPLASKHRAAWRRGRRSATRCSSCAGRSRTSTREAGACGPRSSSASSRSGTRSRTTSASTTRRRPTSTGSCKRSTTARTSSAGTTSR